MTPEQRERMIFLCTQISQETDHAKFLQLVKELNQLLDEKEQRVSSGTYVVPKEVRRPA